jgi:hypothetical protein
MKMKKRYLVYGAILLTIIYLAIKFNYTPKIASYEGQPLNKDAYALLQHLKFELQNGAAEKMQIAYPEGFVFMQSLYALSWCNLLSQKDPPSQTIIDEGLLELTKAASILQSDTAKFTFHEDMVPKYGAFYNGWVGYTLGKIVMVNKKYKSSALENLFNDYTFYCKVISQSLRQSNTIFINSYQEDAWPCDVMVCIAALNNYAQVANDTLYTTQVKAWIDSLRYNHLDSSTNLIPHKISPINGKIMEGPRGSSLSMMLLFLSEIDHEFALSQYNIFKKTFLDKRLWRYGFREYQKGTYGEGDIDSGPVIWDIGAAASVMGMHAAYAMDDKNLYHSLSGSIEAFGFSYTWDGKRKYLFGQLPIVDAFNAWVYSAYHY